MDNPISIAELDSLEELWKVFVNDDLDFGDSIAPFSDKLPSG